MRRQIAHLPLHGGKAPGWLFERMHRLAGSITQLIVEDRGPQEMLNRLADPFWFQAFGCVLGFDWHSSGLTTVTCGALKEAYRRLGPELGIHVAGGKGAVSRKTPGEVVAVADRRALDGDRLVYASRMSAKVDSAAVQDGYQIYTHHFFYSDANDWCVVQQGMNERNSYARRYHWLGSTVEDFVCEPHNAVASAPAEAGGTPLHDGSRAGRPCYGSRAGRPCYDLLNMVAAEAGDSRRRSAELACLKPEQVLKEVAAEPSLFLPAHHAVKREDVNPAHLNRILGRIYEQQPADFERLLGLPGVGPATVRSLALIAELVYGAPACRRDVSRRCSPEPPGMRRAGEGQSPSTNSGHDPAEKGQSPSTNSGLRRNSVMGTVPPVMGTVPAPWSSPATFSYAHGGKDGHPFPVDRATYDKSIALLESAVRRARIDPAGKDQALHRLARWAGS